MRKFYYKFKNFLREFFKTQFGKRLLYELKSFLMTFWAVFGFSILAQLKDIIENQNLTYDIIGAFITGVVLSMARFMFVYLGQRAGLHSYRESTIKYK